LNTARLKPNFRHLLQARPPLSVWGQKPSA
jgi:hypothetical protein